MINKLYTDENIENKLVLNNILDDNLKKLDPVLNIAHLWQPNSCKLFALTKIPKEVYGFIHLKEIHLGGSDGYYMSGLTNQLTKITKELCKLENLELIALGENKLTRVPKQIYELKNLKSLYLHNNLISSLPESFGQLENLEILTLYNNPIIDFPQSMSQLKKLKKLVLFGNGFKEIPDFIYSLSSLEELIMLGPNYNDEVIIKNQTKITNISSKILELKKLRRINLSGHGLTINFKFPNDVVVVL